MTAFSSTRLYGWAASVTSFARIIASKFGAAGSRLRESNRWKTWTLSIALFAIVWTVAPLKLVAIPGYFVCWMFCLAGAWILMEGR